MTLHEAHAHFNSAAAEIENADELYVVVVVVVAAVVMVVMMANDDDSCNFVIVIP